MRPHTLQARVQVLVLGQAHLQATLLGGGVQGEDVQDQRRAVDDLHALGQGLLQVDLLGGGQFLVEDDQVRLQLLGHVADLGHLARAHVGAGVGRVQALGEDGHRVGAGGVGQAFQFRQGGFHGPLAAREFHAHQDGAFPRLVRSGFDEGVGGFSHGRIIA